MIFRTKRLDAYFVKDENKHHIIDLYNRKENIEFIEGISAEADIELTIECYKTYQNIGAYLFFENESNKFVGFGGIQKQEFMNDGSLSIKDSDIEFLIVMHKEFEGKGYASEFCDEFFKLVSNKFPQLKIPARVNPANVSCIKLLKKFGFAEEGEVDYHVYGNKFLLLRKSA